MDEVMIRELRSADQQELRHFVCTDFFPTEPLCRAIPVDPVKDGQLWFDSVFQKCLNDGLSVVAVDAPTGKLIGMRFAAAVYKGDDDDIKFSKEDPKTRNLALLYEPALAIYKDFDLFTMYGVDKLVNFRGMCVAQSCRGRGIGQRMVSRTIELAKQKGFPIVSAESDSRFSSKIFQNVGFEIVKYVPFDKCTLDGKPIEMTSELEFHQGVAVHVKRL